MWDFNNSGKRGDKFESFIDRVVTLWDLVSDKLWALVQLSDDPEIRKTQKAAIERSYDADTALMWEPRMRDININSQ